MHWKLKAMVQNLVSILPNEVSFEVYYQFQRRFGRLRRVNPSKRLEAGIETWKKIQQQDNSPIGKTFFEVGTGRVPIVPLAFWLLGADKTVTIDLNPYLKDELVLESIKWIDKNEAKVRKSFGDLLFEERLNALLYWFRNDNFTVSEFLDICQIQYIAPADASKTGLASKSIDFHTSFTVFEHIPKSKLIDILLEGNRIIKDDGIFIHRIDYSDHFSHSDRNISAINFLSFSEKKWEKIAGNRYMYMNRLRHDDFCRLFEQADHDIIQVETNFDSDVENTLLGENIEIEKEFSSKSIKILSITSSWIVSKVKYTY